MQGRYCLWVILCFLLLGVSAGRAATQTDTIELPPIRVLGERKTSTRQGSKAEFSHDVISAEGEKAITQVLKESPSVSVQLSGGEGAEPLLVIRGQDPIQNRYFLEDIPLTDGQFQSSSMILVPPSLLSSVTLYPGGVPLFLGEDGFGGALNLGLSDWREQTSVDFGSRVGSFGYFNVFSSGHFHSARKFYAALDYVQSDEDFVYYDDNGTLFNDADDGFRRRAHNNYRRVTFVPRFSLYESKRHQVRFLSLNTYGEKQLPGPVSRSTRGELKQIYHLGAIQYAGQTGNWRPKAHLFWRLDHQSTDKIELPYYQLGNSSSSALAIGLKGSSKMAWGGADHAEAVVGLTVDRYFIRVKSRPEDETQKWRWQLPIGIGSKIYLKYPQLSIRPGLLGHYYRYSLGGRSAFETGVYAPKRERSFFLLSPRVGVQYRPHPAWEIRSSVGSYYRAPSMYELYGAPVGMTPSQNLEPERAYKGEIGVRWSYRHSSSFVRKIRAGYHYSFSQAENLISYIESSQKSYEAINIGKSRIQNHELYFEGETKLNLTLRSSVSFLVAQNLSPISYQYGRALPHRPDYRLYSGLAYAKGGIRAEYVLFWTGPSYWDLANLKRLGSTLEHSIYLSWETKRFGTFGLEVRNLTDTITATSAFSSSSAIVVDNTTGFAGYPAPGRRIYFSWRHQI